MGLAVRGKHPRPTGACKRGTAAGGSGGGKTGPTTAETNLWSGNLWVAAFMCVYMQYACHVHAPGAWIYYQEKLPCRLNYALRRGNTIHKELRKHRIGVNIR